MTTSSPKPRIVKDYEKLTQEVKELLKIVYPSGFAQHLVKFTNPNGEQRKGLPFETDDTYYLIRMSPEKAEEIIERDSDYDDDGNLRSEVKEEYVEKYQDEEFLGEYNANEDNDFGEDFEV